jgi:hypothetical protein
MNACRSVCAPTFLVIPARRAAWRTIQPSAIGGPEDRPRAPFADGQVDRSRGTWRERDGDDLPALAGDHECPVPALDP